MSLTDDKPASPSNNGQGSNRSSSHTQMAAPSTPSLFAGLQMSDETPKWSNKTTTTTSSRLLSTTAILAPSLQQPKLDHVVTTKTTTTTTETRTASEESNDNNNNNNNNSDDTTDQNGLPQNDNDHDKDNDKDNDDHDKDNDNATPEEDTKEAAKTAATPVKETETASSSLSSATTYLGGWLGAAASTTDGDAAAATTTTTTFPADKEETNNEETPSSADVETNGAEESLSPNAVDPVAPEESQERNEDSSSLETTALPHEEADRQPQQEDDNEKDEQQQQQPATTDNVDQSAVVEDATTATDRPTELSPTKSSTDVHLRDAFGGTPSQSQKTPLPQQQQQHHNTSRIPNADVALRILRKYAQKTQPHVLSTYGGTKSRPILSYIFTAKEDPIYVPYRDLMAILYPSDDHDDTNNNTDNNNNNDENTDRIVNSLMGVAGDTMDRAKRSVRAFCHLFSMWGHASSHSLLEDTTTRAQQEEFSNLLRQTLDAASALVAHGCLDGVAVPLKHSGNNNNSTKRNSTMLAVDLMAQSVFNSDLSLERNELAAIKFLLGTGIRVSAHDGTALLHGSYLLQTIRTLYHVYLTTDARPNRTTARAALQQLTTSVWKRVVAAPVPSVPDSTTTTTSNTGTSQNATESATDDAFPTPHHRDAYLVLRSLCKLSMRSLPGDMDSGGNFVGLQSSGSTEAWDERHYEATTNATATPAPTPTKPYNNSSSADSTASADSERTTAQLVYTSAVHPALESKLLALELILSMLQNLRVVPKTFLDTAGPQFHAAIRNYLCVSLLKNCTSDNTAVVNLSLRIFVPLVHHFRALLKNEIEAFVTNVFFVILDSKHSPPEHKTLVVQTFAEICSAPKTLAEIFLNYDCDLSAVDLFHRIVQTLSTVSRTGMGAASGSLVATTSLLFALQQQQHVARERHEIRELRLAAMKALRQVLASLHGSIVEPLASLNTTAAAAVSNSTASSSDNNNNNATTTTTTSSDAAAAASGDNNNNTTQNLVEMYGNKKKRRAEQAEIVLRFNQKPSAGIAYANHCGHVQGSVAADVARYLLEWRDDLDKTQIGEYLGREAEYQGGFSLQVLHEYVRLLDFGGQEFDEAIRYFLSGFRLPGEAQKIDRIMEKFAERFTEQNPNVFPTADVAFILAFSIIMLNTDLHNPAIKEERRMTKDGFIRNNRGICDGKDLPEELLTSIFDRIQKNPISLKEDDEARERAAGEKSSSVNLPAGLSPVSFFSGHYDETDRATKETNFQKERDHIVRTTESILKRRRHHDAHNGNANNNNTNGKTPKARRSSSIHHRFVMAEDSGLRDEYVSPMFDVTWGPALAAFSTAMESANGTIGSLINIATDEELEVAAENAAETIEVCLTGFRFAIGTAGLCGNEVARDAYMGALSGFTQLGSGILLEPRHLRCIQTLLSLAREDSELLGSAWEHVFRALSEVNRFHQLFHLMARNDRVAAAAAERRRARLEAKNAKRRDQARRRAAAEDGESLADTDLEASYSTDDDSLAESDFFDEDELPLEDDMDGRAIDEANARAVYDAVSETIIEGIYERSSSLSAPAVKEFVTQLCHVSRSETYVGSSRHGGGGADVTTDLTKVSYREQHALLANSPTAGSNKDQFHHSQPNIYNLQKLVEVTHYNMDSRPRLIFADLWHIVADHLTEIALHSNPALAMYAVDSFRQLGIQYLQRDELEVFEFQKRFLKPLETVMEQSRQDTTKELLLNCVARLIQIFGGEEPPDGTKQKGGMKSGWKPLLIILGLGGQDSNQSIAHMSSGILHGAIDPCLREGATHTVLLDDYFVDTMTAISMLIDGPHEEIGLKALAQVLRLAEYLGETAAKRAPEKELELWWPMLLGLSKAVGDDRMSIRTAALQTLTLTVSNYFFPGSKGNLCEGKTADENMQTLQLIFRGVLTPILENAETGTDTEDGPRPAIPKDMDLFLTNNPATKGPEEAVEEVAVAGTGWIETTFDLVLDLCVSICQRSIETFHDTALLDEVFSIINNCLVSDCGLLAVRGLQRLEQFVTRDMEDSLLTEDVLATVSHMLRRCLSVRGLPSPPTATEGPEAGAQAAEYKLELREFVAQENLLANRRYIGSHATQVIGLFCTEKPTFLPQRLKLFLMGGMGKGILEWEQAAGVLEQQNGKSRSRRDELAPDYRETALFGRKWMVRLVLHLLANSDSSVEATGENRAQKLVLDETQRLFTRYLEVEMLAKDRSKTALDDLLYQRHTTVVQDLLQGLEALDADLLLQLSWINPVLLGSGTRVQNESVRAAVQALVKRTTPGSTAPYPAATAQSEAAPEEQANDAASTNDESTNDEDDAESIKSGVLAADI